jgi:hypothetical protein
MRALSVTALMVVLGVLLGGAATGPASFKVDEEGFIRNWLVLDPVQLTDEVASHDEETQKPVFDRDYVKKADERPVEGDKVKIGDKEHVWKPEVAEDFKLDLGMVAENRKVDPTYQLFVGVAYVVAPEEMKDVVLAIGSDDSSVWWLNGREVIRVYAGRGGDMDQDVSPKLTLQKGVNVLRFAVINGEGPTDCCARFKTADDKPVTGLTILLRPQ